MNTGDIPEDIARGIFEEAYRCEWWFATRTGSTSERTLKRHMQADYGTWLAGFSTRRNRKAAPPVRQSTPPPVQQNTPAPTQREPVTGAEVTPITYKIVWK